MKVKAAEEEKPIRYDGRHAMHRRVANTDNSITAWNDVYVLKKQVFANSVVAQNRTDKQKASGDQ